MTQYTSEELAFIAEASSSLSAQEIADQTGRSLAAIRLICRKNGWKPRDTRGAAARRALTKYTPERLAEIAEVSAAMSTKDAAEYLGLNVRNLMDIRYRHGIPGRGVEGPQDEDARRAKSESAQRRMRAKYPEGGPWSCASCGEVKPLADFYQAPSGIENHTCRTCQRGTRLKHYYNVTLEQYKQMLEEQGGVCFICQRPERSRRSDGEYPLAVDHDHSCCPGRRSCGECVRGLLCSNCNHVLAKLEELESTDRLVLYLTRPRPKIIS